MVQEDMQRNPGKTKTFAVLLVSRLSMAQTKWMIPASQSAWAKEIVVSLNVTVTTCLQSAALYFPT